MSSLKSIGIDVGVIAKGLNYKVSLFNQRLSDTETKVSTLPFEPSDITDWESCGCGDIDTIPSALDKLAELRALNADRVTVLEQGGGTNGQDGQDGADGASAYQIAVGNGFIGTESEWLESLRGVDGENGSNGTNGIDGNNGDSAYQVAVNNGFIGNEAEWLTSLKGADGIDGVDGTGGSGISVYTTNTLPESANNGESVLVTDGNVSGDGVALSYFYDFAWYRTSDDLVIKIIPQWAPSDIHVDGTNNLIGWYDPSNANLITTDSNNRITSSLSSNASYELSAKSVGPQVGVRKFNNLNVFDFDGTGGLTNASIPTQTFGFYTVILFDEDGIEDGQEFIFDSTTNTSNRVFIRRIGDTLGCQPGGSTDANYPENNTVAYILSFVSDQENDTFKLRANGVDLLSNTSNTGRRTGSGLNIGVNFNTSGNFDGFIGDIIIAQDLSNTEKIEGYLAHKWGLADSLIDEHTYKNSAP